MSVVAKNIIINLVLNLLDKANETKKTKDKAHCQSKKKILFIHLLFLLHKMSFHAGLRIFT